VIILIPAYEPDRRLVDLIRAIRTTEPGQPILVVDDGSGPSFAEVFAAAAASGAEVIGHPTNRGKGYALKAGFAHIAEHHPDHDVVCADCDGQHTLEDILRVADVLADDDPAVVLGSRQFVGDVPARSRFGNGVTRVVFDLVTGHRLQDTQTGLRGYPSWMLGWLQRVGGDRFEYELDVLLAAQREGFGFHEVPIETVYLDGNASSHFRTVRDSIRVYVPVLKFSLSSLAAFFIDATLFFALMAMTGNLAVSVIAARVVSATVNFSVNRTIVFSGHRRPRDAAIGYASLVVALMGANYLLLRLLTQTASVPLVPAKLLTELTLFVVSYQVQRRVVFRSGRRQADDGSAPSTETSARSRTAAATMDRWSISCGSNPSTSTGSSDSATPRGGPRSSPTPSARRAS
jgi:glycosyltransferase involved in cell wall biosynthesis